VWVAGILALAVAGTAGVRALKDCTLDSLRRAALSAPPDPAPIVEGAPPSSSGGLPTLTARELKAKLDSGADVLLVFVGTSRFFEERRIPGARCVPYPDLRLAFREISRDREIILYCGCCGGASEGVSGLALRQLLDMGFQRSRHLLGHFAAWQQAGYAADGTDPAAPVEHAHANEAQRVELQAFALEVDRRRRELEAARAAETDPLRIAEIDRRLEETGREDERRGLELKRKMALENGDAAKVADIDRVLEARSRPDSR
jgi:rhodanese-related sulfurtransferase